MPTCKDCKHYTPAPANLDAHEHARCTSPQNITPDVSPVTGQPITITCWTYCSGARGEYGGIKPSCGLEGRWFEAKAFF